MYQVSQLLRQKRHPLLLTLLIAVVALFVFSFYHRWIHMDDAWFADEALMMARTGQIRSEVFTGFLQYEDKVLNAHKFHVIQGAWFIQLFGFSPWVLKAIPLPYLLLLIVLLLYYQRNFTGYHSTGVQLLTVILLIINASIFEYSYSYRPELSHACLGFFSFLLLHKGVQQNALLPVAAAGLLAGLAAFIHLNGLTFIAAGGGLLFLREEFRKTAVFAFASLAVTALYFFDIGTEQDFQLFLFQFRHDPALKENNFSFWNYFVKITYEHMRLFRASTQASLTGLLLLILLVCFSYLRRNHGFLLMYTLLLVLAVAVITRDINTKYYILYIPFFITIIAQGVAHRFAQADFRWKYVFGGALAVYLIIHTVLDLQLIGRRTDTVATHARVAATIPEGSSIVAPISFVFNQIDRFNIQAIEVYRYLREKGSIQISFWEYCQNTGRQYVILHISSIQDLNLSVEEVRAGGEQFECIAAFPDDYYVCRIKPETSL